MHPAIFKVLFTLDLVVSLNLIIFVARCDCQFDCTFGEDEEGCEKLPMTCMKDLFRCPNEMRYINISWVCDGLGDCTNSADEQPALCASARSATTTTPSSISNDMNLFICSENEFECASGECIPAELVCDKVHHCTDGTDEGSNCSKLDPLSLTVKSKN